MIWWCSKNLGVNLDLVTHVRFVSRDMHNGTARLDISHSNGGSVFLEGDEAERLWEFIFHEAKSPWELPVIPPEEFVKARADVEARIKQLQAEDAKKFSGARVVTEKINEAKQLLDAIEKGDFEVIPNEPGEQG